MKPITTAIFVWFFSANCFADTAAKLIGESCHVTLHMKNGDSIKQVSFIYTGATAITKRWAKRHHCDTSTNAIAFDDGYEEPDCRSYCSNDPGWPRVLDCRAGMGHTYDYDWSWKLILDFFDAHSGI